MTTRLAVLVALVAAAACQHRSTPPRAALDAYVDEGPLRVRGADPSAPGPTIFRALQDDPEAGRVVMTNGEPDALAVESVRGHRRRVVLIYRGGPGRVARRIVVEPATDRAPGRAARPSRRPGAPAVARASEPPTARQALECPVDPKRPDCVAFCDGGTAYEWCR